ncbi:hypothetical protein [Peribacillus simplex]
MNRFETDMHLFEMKIILISYSNHPAPVSPIRKELMSKLINELTQPMVL